MGLMTAHVAVAVVQALVLIGLGALFLASLLNWQDDDDHWPFV